MNIVAVLVIYNCNLGETLTLFSLLNNYSYEPSAFNGFKLIIYDNSPSAQNIDFPIPFAYEYIHDPRNMGLAAAYNYALKKAVDLSQDWLLLLDQDSKLPDNFIANLLTDISQVASLQDVFAVVPKMEYKGKVFSPAKILFGGMVRAIDAQHQGLCHFNNVSAIGSCTAVRGSFLKQVGGFNEMFPIDCLDRWLFLMINKSDARVYVSDLFIDHELSIMNYEQFMNERRYRSILNAETLFIKTYKSRIEKYIFYLRLVKRTLYQFITVRDKRYSLMTLRHLMGLVFTSCCPN